MRSPSDILLECQQLSKTYTQGPQRLEVLRNITLQVYRGERIAIVGASGAGKSTLLNMLGGLDRPSGGAVKVNGQDLAQLTERQRGALRNRQLGFVYQFHHLLGEFTAEENVAMPLLIRGESASRAGALSRALLARIGLEKRIHHKPAELSGGERQRVAIARALVGQPSCVLMDEPTGNLDRHTAADIQALICELSDELGTSFIVVTHDPDFAAQQHRILHLQDGVLE